MDKLILDPSTEKVPEDLKSFKVLLVLCTGEQRLLTFHIPHDDTNVTIVTMLCI